MTPSSEAIDAALRLCDLIIAESLRQDKHAVILTPIVARAEKVISDYFRHQKVALVHWARYRVLREDGSDRKAAQILPLSYSPLTFGVTSHESELYQAAIEDAMRQAAVQLAEEIKYTGTLPATAMENYIREHSLLKLTGDLTPTTTQRLRDAIADAVGRGATGNEIIQVIEATMDGFSERRSGMIAQTEVNGAYNFGRHALAQNAGMSEKRWATESSNPCVACTGNEAEDWIPIGQAFSSGDQMPTAHPNCFCSCDFRLVS